MARCQLPVRCWTNQSAVEGAARQRKARADRRCPGAGRAVGRRARERARRASRTHRSICGPCPRGSNVRPRRQGTRVIYRMATRPGRHLWARGAGRRGPATCGGERARGGVPRRPGRGRAGLRDRARRSLARDEVVLLDVRPEPEYRSGHIAGARSMPMPRRSPRPRQACRDGSEIVAYCRGPYCIYADDAVRLLRARASTRVGSTSASRMAPSGSTRQRRLKRGPG